MLERILTHPEFEDKPPVLVDVGASGHLHPSWKSLARYSICLEFDPDERDFQVDEVQGAVCRKRLRFDKIISADGIRKKLHLTASPYCSSILEPAEEALDEWSFASMFRVVQTATMESLTLDEALKQAGLQRIDWLKLDTQGTDLRILRSLPPDVLQNLKVCELEPGILDAYRGEDKLFHVLEFFEHRPFWLAACNILGPARVRESVLAQNFPGTQGEKLARWGLEPSAFWGEMTYVNRLAEESLTLRDVLLTCAFMISLGFFGAALEYAHRGREVFDAPIFEDIVRHARRRLLRRGLWTVPARLARKFL